ncbi:hypothetical protein AB0O68_15435 [Streptomyces sp. NPDC087512]
MTAIKWLLWAASLWAVVLAFLFVDVPTLLSHLLNRHHGGAR